MSQHESGCTTSIFEVEPRIHIQVEAGREFVRVLRGQGEKKKRLKLCLLPFWGQLSFVSPQSDEGPQTTSHSE